MSTVGPSPAHETPRHADTSVRCPECHHAGLLAEGDHLCCSACRARFPVDARTGVAALLAKRSDTAQKGDIQKWWGDLYRQLYEPTDRTLTPDGLRARLVELEDMFRCRQHLAAVEMPLGDLAGKRVLEIGPGGGGHSSLFKSKGAAMTAVDITPERAMSTAFKLSLLEGVPSHVYQADAENLPFQDDSFDIVYSNGVLHHSSDTDRCLAEVRRVLKPGGRAVLMLYARHSAVFWGNIVPRGIGTGDIFRFPEAEWVGRVTEGKPKFGETKNPFTRIYSEAELRRTLAAFSLISLRKHSFQFDNFAIPRLTQIRNRVMKALGYPAHPGGVLVYGAPNYCETKTELALGRIMGFAWNIVAEKPA